MTETIRYVGDGVEGVAVIIVNWNTEVLLKNCVRSVLSSKGIEPVKIVVVDNGSIDGSLDELEGFVNQKVVVIKNPQNLGFSKACNQGARIASTKYLLFLNPDTEVYSNTIRCSLDFMELPESSDVGVCGVQLIDSAGNIQRSCSEFPSAWMLLARSCGLGAMWPRKFGRGMSFDHRHTRNVDQVMGAYFLIRRSLFEKMGGFDERFFVYYDELDLSLRLSESGWRSVFLAQACAYHKGGGASARVKAHRLFYSLRSRILYAFKHFGRLEAWTVVAGTLVVEPVPRLIRALWRRSMTEVLDTYRGYVMLWRDIPNFIRLAMRH